MTSRARVFAAARFQPTDHIPVGPYMANHCSVLTGHRLRDCYTDGKVLARAQYDAWQLYGQDILTVQADNYYIIEAFPCEIVMPDNANHTPSLIKPPLASLDDLEKLSLPDPQTDGRMPVYIEAMKELRRLVGQEAALRACGVGPFTLAAHLRGTEDFLMELMEAEVEEDEAQQGKLLRLLDFTTDLLIGFATAMLEAGADIVQCADSLASLDMISPAVYRKYAFPFEQRFFKALKEPCKARDALRLLHICGGNTKAYPDFKKLDMDILELDSKVELTYAREQLGAGHIALCGNLAPVATLLEATPEEVYRRAEEAIRAAGASGYILGSGCEVPIAAPEANIRAMIRAAREFAL